MAGLKFSADIELDKIVKLRTEIKGLKADMMALAGKPNSGNTMKSLERQLDKATKELDKYMKKYALMKKAYEEILKSDNTVKAVHEETQALQSTNKWIVANTQAVKEADAEIKKMKADFAALNDTEKVGDKGYNILRQVEQQVAVRKREEEAVRANIKAQKEQIIQNNSEEGSITQLRKQLSLMLNLYDNMGRIKRSGNSGKELLAQIRVIQTELNEAEQASGRFQRNVGNYSSAFNGLGMSIQQIARELPAATMGVNMFFLAISNNLPIFFDEVQKARKEYAAYIEELKKGNTEVQKVAPVWKQIISGVFSLNTALVVGITLLTAYGKEIFNYLDGLINTKRATLDLLSAEQEMALARREAIKSSASERVKLDVLYKATQDHTRSLKERNAAVEELQKMYPSYFGNLSNEAILAGKAKGIYAQLRGELVANAIARAQLNRMEDVANKREEALMKRRVQYNTYLQAQQKVDEASLALENARLKARERGMTEGSLQEKAFLSKRTSEFNDAKNQAQKELDAWKSLIGEVNSYNKILEGMSKNVDIDALIKKYDDKGAGNRNINALTSQQDKILGLESKYALERRRQAEDLEYQIAQARISAMADGYQKVKAQRDLDNKKEIQDLQRQKENAIRAEIEAQKKVFDEQEKLKAQQNKGYKTKTFDASAVDTSNISSAFDSIIGYVSSRQKDDLMREQESAWNEYLIKYGDYQKKKEAITKEYAAKIDSSLTKGERESLKKDLEAQLRELDFSEFKKSIDFADVFGDLDMQTTDALKSLRDKLKDYINAAAKDLRPEDLKELQDALKNIDFKIAKRSPFKELYSGLSEYNTAQNAVKKAQNELNLVMSGGEVITGVYQDETGKLVKKLLSQEEAEKKLSKAQSDRQGVLAKLTKAANTIGSQGMEIVNAGNQIVDMLGNFGVAVPEAVAETLNGIGQTMNALESIDLTKPFSAITGSVGILTGIGNTIAGLLGFGGADYSGYEKMKAQYENLISIWDELITKKMDYIDIDYGTEAIKAAEEAEQLVNIQISRQRQLIKQLASSGASVGSHSLGYRINDRLSKEDYQRISGLVGQKITAEYQLWDLSSEQIEKILSDEKLVSVLDTVNKDFVTYLQNIVDYGEQLTEIAQKEKEAITGIGFDEFKSGYADLLSDLDSTNEDFADNFEQHLQKAIFQSLLANKYKEQIQRLYDSWAEYGKDGITSDEAQALRNMQQNLTNSLLAERDKLMQDFGWQSDSAREASQKGIATASQDSVDENNGRLAVMQGHTYSINENVNRMANGIDSLLNYASSGLSLTTDIERTAKAIESQSRDALNHLANIDSYTSNLVDIRQYMYAVKNGIDTLNTKGLTLKR